MALPNLFPFNGDWASYEDAVYQIYLEEIVNANLRFKGLEIRYKYHPESKNKHYAFWHLIQEGEIEEEREPDLRRCERMRWIAYLIKEAGKNSEISWWENRRHGNTHVVIWHEQENFVVILAKRTEYFLLKTAYCAKPHRARTFIKERKDFWDAYKD